MNHDRALMCSCGRGGDAGSKEGRKEEGESVCQVEDELTSAPRELLNERGGSADR